jgi:methylglutaconyl-CoA hydratase
MDSLILLKKIEPGISLVTLNRAEKCNALNISLLSALVSTLEQLKSDPEQRVLLINGAGKAFCSGLDLLEASEIKNSEKSAEMMAQALSLIYTMPQITISVVHGAALAGGMGIACACDYVLAADSTNFGFPEVHRGLVPAQILTLLMRQLSERHVRELLLFGEIVQSEKALKIGLINQIVPEADLLSAAISLAKKALKGAPGAITATKRLIEKISSHSLNDDLAEALKIHLSARISPEAKEGLAAFLEKRKPSWF